MVIKKTFWFFLGIITLSLIATWYTGRYSSFPGSRVVFLRLSVLGILLVLVNWVWTWLSIRKLELKRKQRVNRLQVGNVFEERFDIDNPVRISRLWLEIKDLSDLPGRSGSKVLSKLGPRQDRFYISRTVLTKRGSFLLGPTLLRSGDPFGMFESTKIFSSERSLVVLPYMEPLEYLDQPPGFLSGGRAVRQKSLEATSYASGVRDYLPGDPLNRIHWRSSAKRDRFMVKEFDQDPQADVWILLDGDNSARFPVDHEIVKDMIDIPDAFWAWKQDEAFKLPPDTFEYAVSAAASLANYYIKSEKSVGLACADNVMTVIPTEKGERQLGKILETLAFVQGNGTLPVSGLVEIMSHQIPRGSTVYIVTSNTKENIQVGIEVLLRKHLNPFVILIDRESFGGASELSKVRTYFDYQTIPHAVIRCGEPIGPALQNQGFE